MALIQSLLNDERPRERCLTRGARSLSLKECLALIISSGPRGKGCMGLACDLLAPFSPDDAASELERSLFSRLESAEDPQSGILSTLPPAARARLLAAFELARRYSALQVQKTQRRLQSLPSLPVLSRNALIQIPAALRCETHEWLGFLPAYRGHELGRLIVVARGQANRLNLHPRELFSRLLPLQAGGFFLAHNHPSDDPQPSPEDLHLTREVRRLAQQLGVPLLGHWIVGPTRQNWIDSRGLIMGEL